MNDPFAPPGTTAAAPAVLTEGELAAMDHAHATVAPKIVFGVFAVGMSLLQGVPTLFELVQGEGNVGYALRLLEYVLLGGCGGVAVVGGVLGLMAGEDDAAGVERAASAEVWFWRLAALGTVLFYGAGLAAIVGGFLMAAATQP
ncbi:MAG: hypothetical protein H6734_27570 [Alphaproteobacteria bacterium]|nr:hypothetical protein [Alphaproteobacteria bacterium]MCB9688134.1 hypothetical protein [Alphaproteobacteria bacterium]